MVVVVVVVVGKILDAWRRLEGARVEFPDFYSL